MIAFVLFAIAIATVYWVSAEYGDDLDAMLSAFVVSSLLCSTAISSDIALSSRIGIGMMISLAFVLVITTVISRTRKGDDV